MSFQIETNKLGFFLKEFVAKIFEVISVSELPIKREIIGWMPEIVDDSLHPDVCQRLK